MSEIATAINKLCGTVNELRDENARLEAENANLRSGEGLMTIKRLENCSMFWAKTNDGRWHYLNHADTWQPFQGPESNVRIAALEAENADLRSGWEALKTAMAILEASK